MKRRAYTAAMGGLLRFVRSRVLLCGLAAGLFSSLVCGFAQQIAKNNPLARRYRDGETLSYNMTGVNQGHDATTRYTARETGAVSKDAAGVFVEKFGWSDLIVNGKAVAFPPELANWRQVLSLDPKLALTVPDLSKVPVALIAPITDLLTFYADLQLVGRSSGLTKAGDHVYFKHGTPNSWADGQYFVLGEDSVDFDITLKAIDEAQHVATVVVRHVPPANPEVKLPAEWMAGPVSDTKNNWVEVAKQGDAKYVADVGKETFAVEMRVDTRDGKLLAAKMENPVEVLERECTDPGLAHCGEPVRYQILRQITIAAE